MYNYLLNLFRPKYKFDGGNYKCNVCKSKATHFVKFNEKGLKCDTTPLPIILEFRCEKCFHDNEIIVLDFTKL